MHKKGYLYGILYMKKMLHTKCSIKWKGLCTNVSITQMFSFNMLYYIWTEKQFYSGLYQESLEHFLKRLSLIHSVSVFVIKTSKGLTKLYTLITYQIDNFVQSLYLHLLVYKTKNIYTPFFCTKYFKSNIVSIFEIYQKKY